MRALESPGWYPWQPVFGAGWRKPPGSSGREPNPIRCNAKERMPMTKPNGESLNRTKSPRARPSVRLYATVVAVGCLTAMCGCQAAHEAERAKEAAVAAAKFEKLAKEAVAQAAKSELELEAAKAEVLKLKEELANALAAVQLEQIAKQEMVRAKQTAIQAVKEAEEAKAECLKLKDELQKHKDEAK